MLAKYRAGNGVRTRDIQLGKLFDDVRIVKILAACAGKNQAAPGRKRVETASSVWEGVWEDDPLDPLRRAVPGGAS